MLTIWGPQLTQLPQENHQGSVILHTAAVGWRGKQTYQEVNNDVSQGAAHSKWPAKAIDSISDYYISIVSAANAEGLGKNSKNSSAPLI